MGYWPSRVVFTELARGRLTLNESMTASSVGPGQPAGDSSVSSLVSSPMASSTLTAMP
jgi:hypothetical protein